MRYRALFGGLVGCIFFLASFSIEASLSNVGKTVIANFGKITAVEPVVQKLTLPYNIQLSQKCGLTILAETPGLIEHDSGRVLPWKRMKLMLGEKNLSVSAYQPVKLAPASEVQEIILMVQGLFEPSDRPGNYEGIITLQSWRENEAKQDQELLKSIKIYVKVEISAWVRLNSENFKVNINEVTGDGVGLRTVTPVNLKVASNDKWAVFLNLNQNDLAEGKVIPINLQIFSRINSVQTFPQTFKEKISNSKIIAAGMPTVNGKDYWCELPLSFTIDSYTKYPAGKCNFQFNCTGEVFGNQI